MGRRFCLLSLAVWLALPVGQALGYGLFACVDPAGRRICLIDTGSRTGFSPKALCAASCPACAGKCDAVRFYPPASGRWVETWHDAPGISGDNRLVPGGDAGRDAATIVREGLAAPVTPPPSAPQSPARP